MKARPRLIIATGPQGSGNHLFAKLFGSNPNIFAWPSLQDKYWEGHDMEPFADYWHDPESLLDFDVSKYPYYYASQGTPYIFDGEQRIPNYPLFHAYATQVFEVSYMIIGRDRNILEHQQNRVRGKHTTPLFLEQLKHFKDHHHIYACQELAYLYGIEYINNLEQQLYILRKHRNNNQEKVAEILSEDKNRKYMQYVEHTELDELIKLASSRRGAL